MIKNFFRTAWRNILNNGFYSLINIAGLAIGLTSAILLLLWIQHEKSWDKAFADHDNIYGVSAEIPIDGKNMNWDAAPGPLSLMSATSSDVASYMRINESDVKLIKDGSGERQFTGKRIAFADSNFFRFFDYPVTEGNAQTALNDLNSIVISSSLARQLFSTDQSVVGNKVIFRQHPYQVTAVMPDFPDNSSLQYEAIIPMSVYAKEFTDWGGNGDWKTIDQDLGNYSFRSFVKLRPGADPDQYESMIADKFNSARKPEDRATPVNFRLRNLADFHLVAIDGSDSPRKLLDIFLLIAILLLAIASINYINLSTARAISRAREVSIRKVIGAAKIQLFFQFIFETFLVYLLAILLAIGLAWLIIPLFNQVSGQQLSFNWLNTQVWQMIVVCLVATLLAVSIYPAIILSGFRPIEMLKTRGSSNRGNPIFRKVLVVIQFTVSVALIAVTLVISKQMRYLRDKNIGYDRSYVFSVELPEDAKEHGEAIKADLLNSSTIESASVAGINNLHDFHSATSDLEWSGKAPDQSMVITQAPIDEKFIPTMKLEFLEGGNFTGAEGDNKKFILNEAAVKQMGLKKPWVGQQISFHSREGEIIGVVKDFNYVSMKEKIEPLIFFSKWWTNGYLYVRTRAGAAQTAIAAVKSSVGKYSGNQPFEYHFLDEQFDTVYRSDLRTGTLFNVFAVIAVIISCLGLLGLATYSARMRIKEIGVRKVLGASSFRIVGLLAKDFLLLVLIAVVIAIPLARWAIGEWIQEYAYRTKISAWVFVVAATGAFLIAFLTISSQALKAALTNPVKSLRTE